MSKKTTNKPYAAIDPAVVTQTRQEWRGKPAATIEAERASVERDMERAVEQAGPDFDLEKVTTLNGSLADKAKALVTIHSRLSGIEDALQERTELERVARDIRDGNRGGGGEQESPVQPVSIQRPRPPSIADHVFADLRERGLDLAREARSRTGVTVETSLGGNDILDTLFETGAGWDPFVQRQPGYVPIIQRPVQVVDIFPRFPTRQHSIDYMEQTTRTNAAAEVAEGGSAPEATIEFTERSDPVRQISVHIPVTEVQLEDEDQMRSILDMEMIMMLRQRLDGQVLNGDGSAPNISGVLERSNVSGIDWTHDANKVLEKPLSTMKLAKTKVALTGRAMASHYILHHSTWDETSLSESASGGYYLTNPVGGFEERIWGLPVVLSDHLEDGTAEDTVNGLCGDFLGFSKLWIRRDFVTSIGFSGDDYLKDTIRIKGTVRAALQVTRPQAFCTISRPA